MSHWWTVHSPPTFSAMRASPLSSAAIAASTAWRTSPLVAGPIESRSSQARSMIGLQRVGHSSSPRIASSHSPTSVDAMVDDAVVVAVVAALGAIVDPHRRHSERFRRREVLGHVVDQQRAGRVDAEALAQQLAIAVRVGLGRQLAAWMSCRSSKSAATPIALEHPPRIRRVAVGEDELAARAAAPAPRPAGRRARRRSSGMAWTSSRKSCGSTSWCFISPASVVPCRGNASSGPAAPRSRSQSEQALDIGAHALVDQREQAGSTAG